MSPILHIKLYCEYNCKCEEKLTHIIERKLTCFIPQSKVQASKWSTNKKHRFLNEGVLLETQLAWSISQNDPNHENKTSKFSLWYIFFGNIIIQSLAFVLSHIHWSDSVLNAIALLDLIFPSIKLSFILLIKLILMSSWDKPVLNRWKKRNGLRQSWGFR